MPDACCEVYVTIDGVTQPKACLDKENWTGLWMINKQLVMTLDLPVEPVMSIRLKCYEENCDGEGMSCVYDTHCLGFDDSQLQETMEVAVPLTAPFVISLTSYSVTFEVFFFLVLCCFGLIGFL